MYTSLLARSLCTALPVFVGMSDDDKSHARNQQTFSAGVITTTQHESLKSLITINRSHPHPNNLGTQSLSSNVLWLFPQPYPAAVACYHSHLLSLDNHNPLYKYLPPPSSFHFLLFSLTQSLKPYTYETLKMRWPKFFSAKFVLPDRAKSTSPPKHRGPKRHSPSSSTSSPIPNTSSTATPCFWNGDSYVPIPPRATHFPRIQSPPTHTNPGPILFREPTHLQRHQLSPHNEQSPSAVSAWHSNHPEHNLVRRLATQAPPETLRPNFLPRDSPSSSPPQSHPPIQTYSSTLPSQQTLHTTHLLPSSPRTPSSLPPPYSQLSEQPPEYVSIPPSSWLNGGVPGQPAQCQAVVPGQILQPGPVQQYYTPTGHVVVPQQQYASQIPMQMQVQPSFGAGYTPGVVYYVPRT